VILSVTLFVLAGMATIFVLGAFARGAHHRERLPTFGARFATAVAIALLALGAYVVVSTTRWANEDLDIGWLGYPGAALLGALILLTAVQPARAGALLRVGAALLVPLLAVLTALTYVFEPSEWREAGIGPLVGGVLFFAIPALIVARVARMAGEFADARRRSQEREQHGAPGPGTRGRDVSHAGV
jgi:hypothetical protein